MTALTWRMNGLWRRMAVVLMLCALLLSSEVMCQDTTATTPASSLVLSTSVGSATPKPSTSPSNAAGGQGPAVPEDPQPSNEPEVTSTSTTDAPPSVQSVKEQDSPNVSSNQEGGSTKSEPSSSSSSSGSPVFVGILVTGLLAALAITVGYFKCQRRSEPKGVKLAEEAYPVDQDNQGNTLVSVAPLNPPPETQEKPNINGESTEPAKTEPPAPPSNNGHSATKTADTEL